MKQLAFTTEEYKDRLRRVKESMAARGIDLLLCNDPANLCYLTGYDAYSFYTPQLLVVPIDEDMPYIMLRSQDLGGIKYTSWLDAAHEFDYPEHYVHNPVHHPMEAAADFINEHHFADNKVVAFEMDCMQLSAMSYEVLKSRMPKASRFVDAANLVNWVRVVKSPAEIETMRKAAKITENIFDTVYKNVHTGMRQCDLAAKVYETSIRGTEEYGGEYCAMFPFMCCGDRSEACHLSWTNDPYEPGQILMFEWAGVHNRYHVPTCRTLMLGKAKYKSMYDTNQLVVEALEAALNAAKPGILLEEVPKACSGVFAKWGFDLSAHTNRMGYSIGIAYPPDWGERTISVRPGDKTLLQEGMTFHLRSDNLGFALNPEEEPYGIHFSEAIVITKNGAECLTHIPRDLFVAE